MLDSLQLILKNSNPLLQGLWITLQLAIIVIIAGTLIGIAGGLALSYGPRPLRLIVRAYVDLLRGIPVLVTIFVIFYGLPIVLGVDSGALFSVALALSIFAGAHVTEIVRGAVTSVPKTQTEAAKSIGLTFWPRMQYVILPQAIRRALPPWVNLCVEVIKGTSLVSLVSVSDLMLNTTKLIQRTHDPIPFYIAAGVLYFIVCFTLSRASLLFERRFSRYV
jgi:polar amino acid transport system permease protein